MSTGSFAAPFLKVLAREGGEKWEVSRFGSVCGQTNNVVDHFCVLFSNSPGDHPTNKKTKTKKKGTKKSFCRILLLL